MSSALGLDSLESKKGTLDPSDVVEELALVAQWEAAPNVLGILQGPPILSGEPQRLHVVCDSRFDKSRQYR